MTRFIPRLGAAPLAAWRGIVLTTVLLMPAAGAHAHRLAHEHAPPEPSAAVVSHGPAPMRVRALIDRYHLSGDDRLLDQGWRLLDPLLAAAEVNPATLLAAAWLAQAGHDFAQARDYLRHVLLLRPDHGEAWLLGASVALVQGDVQAARHACRRTTLTVPVVITVACFARTEAHGADAAGIRDAYRRLAATIEARDPADPALRGWLQGASADLAARAGLEVEAEAHYQAALDLTPTVSVRAGFADLLLDAGRPREVLDLIGAEATAPALVLRRLLAEQALGTGPGPRRLDAVDARFEAWIAAGDLRHAREMALFYLRLKPDPQRAFELAGRNFELQREPEDRALLCQAADRVGAPVGADCRTAVTSAGSASAAAVSSVHGH